MPSTPPCPEFSLLSQFLDDDLEKSEANRLDQHVASCYECRVRIRDLKQAKEFERATLSAGQPLLQPTLSAQCLAPEALFAYAQGMLSPAEEQRVENHVSICGLCLNEVKEVTCAASTLATIDMASVPSALDAQVASNWVTTPVLPRLVIQLTQEGLRLLDKYLIAPLLDVQEVLVPLPTYRSQSASGTGRMSPALGLRLDAGEAEISVAAVREQHGVVVKLTLIGTEQKVLGGRRIFLRQRGRAVFSEQTDDQGVLFMPLLAPGTYEVACHEIHTTFLLELRP